MQEDLPSQGRSNHLAVQETWSLIHHLLPQHFLSTCWRCRGESVAGDVATDTEEAPKGMADAGLAQGCLAFHAFRPTRLR